MNYLSQTPLQKNEDYASQSVTLVSGQLTTSTLQEVPTIRKGAASNPAISGTFYAHTNRIVQGNFVTFTATIDIDEQLVSPQSTYTFVLPIPEGMEVVGNSFLLGGRLCDYTHTDKQI